MIIRKPTDEELSAMYLQRWEVMRKPFGLPKGSEKDDEEEISDFVIAVDKAGKIIGSAKIIIYDTTGKINHVAVNSNHRKKEIGMKLMSYLHKKAIESGLKELFIDSRIVAEGFYQKMGYERVSEVFAKKPTNAEHVKMVMKLKK